MISFVGAGSGDPEYITLKGYRLLQQADVVLYAGSLINPEILGFAREDAKLIDSAPLYLQQIVDLMVEAYRKGEVVVRLHTGDPSLFGAIGEQMECLKEIGIPFQVIPGVSSFLAAAAALQREYTVPDGTQTLIITRLEGRTPVPEREKLSELATHQSSMAIFLSVGMIEQVVEQLRLSYDIQTPVAVVEKASWKEETIVRGTLADIADKTKQAGITKTALILVGEFLQTAGVSKLYDKGFSHEYRN